MNFCIIGLGNPTKKYQLTRHNVGFLALEETLKSLAELNFQYSKKLEVNFIKTQINKDFLLFIQPLSFMNKSGECLKKFLDYQKISLLHNNKATIKKSLSKNNSKHLFLPIIIRDDSDREEGEIKIIQNSGSSGHHGVENIFQYFPKTNFVQIKIGIRPPKNKEKSENFVLAPIGKNGKINLSIKKIPTLLKILIKEGIEKAQNSFNT